MKRILSVLAAVLLLALTVVPVFASEGVDVVPAVPSGSVSNYEGDTVGTYTSLVDAVNSLFGRYNPRTHVVTTYLSDGTTVETVEVLPGLAGLDYAWLASVLLFALALYCIFRMIGGLFRWK